MENCAPSVHTDVHVDMQTPVSVEEEGEPLAWGKLAAEQLVRELCVWGASAASEVASSALGFPELVELGTRDYGYCYYGDLWLPSTYHVSRCAIL